LKLSKTVKTGSFNFLAMDRVHFGTPAADALSQEVSERQAKRVFVVTSRSLHRKTNAVKDAVAKISDRVVGLFDECVEHTPRESVIALAQALRETQADLVVSMGGGTVIDTVKIALVCLAGDVQRVEDLDEWHIRVKPEGGLHVPVVGRPPCRQIAIPTTLSGAEFSDLGGGTDTRTGVKHGFTGRYIGPVAVILDPRVTVHTPDRLWLSTGIRAVDHAVEALCSINAQALVDATSVRALALLKKSLLRYLSDPSDLEARLDGQLGAWLASTSIRRTDYGASHGLGHALGADTGTPHGITSCVLLPTVMRFNQNACSAQLAEVAIAFGDPSRSAADQVEALVAQLGLPTRLSMLGMDQSRLPIIAEKGMANMWVRTNPQPITEAAQLLEILNRAWA
jgi:maleylacetate reductase